MGQVVEPLIAEMAKQDMEYTGCLYVGLMWGANGPSVVEFNVRLGDPEAQVLAVNDKRDWGEIIADKLGFDVPGFDANKGQAGDRHSVAVVMAGEGYPYEKPKEKVSPFKEQLFANEGSDTAVFGASVLKENDQLLPGGGRVLTVVQTAADFQTAREEAYERVKEISQTWPKVQFRNDIALRVTNEV